MVRKMILALGLAACGSKSPPPASAEQGAHSANGMEMTMSPELKKFHDTLAPRWHAEKGPQRVTDTCNAVGQFKSDADAVAKATPPRGANPDDWTSGAKLLVDAVAGLETACTRDAEHTGFDDAFAKVHVSFHHMLEASGGMHMEHMEHMDHHDHEDHPPEHGT
jgi:hypothetical protein